MRREPRRRGRSFYERALDAGDRELLADAREVEGLDEEVALLRLEVRRLLGERHADPRVLHAGLRLLIQALAARQRLSGRQSEDLGEAAAQLIEQFGAIFAGGSGTVDG